jgi:hypothetical protein
VPGEGDADGDHSHGGRGAVRAPVLSFFLIFLGSTAG